MATKKRDSFVSKFGIIAAAAGSAVGLGNIWRFPYITGENGGGAFLLLYVFFVVVIGVPAMIAELIIGQKSKKNAVGAFKKLRPGTPWKIVGIAGVFTGFIILAFYGTVASWTMHYTYLAFEGKFTGMTTAQLNALFENFHTSALLPVLWQIVFMILTAAIVLAGVSNGIEKYTKILMPLLFVILIVLDIKSLTLNGSKAGMDFLFHPDFSKITAKTVLEALGQAFFSLSLGMGVLITYGSYIKDGNKLGNIAFEVAFFDTLVAILAGIAIFPAVFAFGLKPGAGPGLVFQTLPAIFGQMTGGHFFAILFFLLLVVAALTSSISLLEVVVAAATEELKMSRRSATVWAALVITALGILATLSFGVLSDLKITGKTVFDFLDFLSSNILLPVGGFFIVIFVAWVLREDTVQKELKARKNSFVFSVFVILLKYLVPLAIFAVFLNSIGIIKF